MKECFPQDVFYDNIGNGFRMECSCGYATCPCATLEDVGRDMDAHLKGEECSTD